MTLLRLGQPTLRGRPKGAPWTPQPSAYEYAIDWPNESATAAGFEQEFISDLLIGDRSEDGWGIFPELGPGYWYFVEEWAEDSTTMETDDPVDGSRYMRNQGSGSGSYWLYAAFLDYGFVEGDYTAPNFLASAWPPSGPVRSGQLVRWRIAHRSNDTDTLGMDFAWLAEDGSVLGTPSFIAFTPATTWEVARTAGIATIGVLDDEEVSTALTAPEDAFGFSMVVIWEGTADQGGNIDLDALRIEVSNS